MRKVQQRIGVQLVAAFVVLVAVWLQVGQSHATPARAQGLAGLDPFDPSVNTFVYFNDDVNIFANPGLIYRYRNSVGLSLGVEGGGPSGVGAHPFGGFLIEPGEAGFVMGLYLNRDYNLFGEGAGIAPVLATLGGMGNDFNTSNGYAYGADMPSPEVRFPLDVFVGGHFGDTTIGANIYVAGGLMSGHSENLVNEDDDIWNIEDAKAKSMFTSIKVGFQHDGKSFRPGAWIGFAKADSWADTFAYNTDDGDDEPSRSHTEGLSNAMKLTAGARFEVDLDTVVIVPHLGLSYGMGGLFVDENLGDETAIANDANNEYKASNLNLNAGSGFTYKPKDDLNIIWTTSLQLSRSTLSTNDHVGDMDDDMPDGAKTTQTYSANTLFAGPVVSVAAEYRPFKHLKLRGGVRANVLFGRDSDRDVLYVGGDVHSDGKSQFDQANEPSLIASFGMTVPMGALSLEGTFGGLVMGSADQQFFSRLDLRAKW